MTVVHEVELISDGDGLAVIGDPTAVERFMSAVGLESSSTAARLGTVLSAGSSAAQAGAEIASSSGRWVRLTKESAQKLKKYPLTPTDKAGISHAMLGQRGSIKQWLQIETPKAVAKNPALLSGAAGIMAQMAMQQAMDEIIDYLASIDAKLDDVLRAQTNQVLARLDGVDLAVREAMSVRASVGRVSEVTWSKVQSSAQTIHETQGYALRQLGDLADKIDSKKKISDLVDVAKEAEAEVRKWLLVLARCYELHDAVGLLELDRVLDSSPDELDRHRLGLKAAREDRLELISERTERLLERMDAAASVANSKVLLNPMQSPAVIKSSNHVSVEIHEFHELLGIESGLASSEARRWKDAASERWEKVRETGAVAVESAKKVGGETRVQARSMTAKLSSRIADRRRRESKTTEEPEEQG